MPSNSELSRALSESLSLDLPPIAVRFAQTAPAGVQQFEGDVPSACSFWRRAEDNTFFASDAAHHNCLVGAYTMGLPMNPDQSAELMDLIGQMQAAGYLDASEVPNIPTVPGEKAGIVYGPLAQFTEPCDAVLVWLTARQAMLLQEATANAAWSGKPGIHTFGRPSCAAIPAALNEGTATVSLGCTGMRTFTEIPDDRMLGVLPRQILDTLVDGLARMGKANNLMLTRYAAQKVEHGG